MPPSDKPARLSASQGLLALHSATTPLEVSANLAGGLHSVGYEGGYSLLLSDPESDDLVVFETSVANVSLGVTVPRDRVHAGLASSTSHRLPLSANGEDYGCLLLHDETEIPASQLGTFALHLGTALLNSQVSEERRLRHAADVTKLGYIAQLPPVLATGELDPILAKLMQVALAALGGEAGAVAFRARDQSRISVHVEWGLDDAFVDALVFNNGQPVIEHVVAQREPLILHRADGFPSLRPSPLLDCVENIVVVPLSTAEDRPGCIVIVNARSFAHTDMEVVQVLESLTSSAIERMNHAAEALEREQFQQQLRLAGSIQRSLLPLQCPESPGLQVTAVCEPCDDAGGDYYDFFGAGRGIGFVIGDAAGHGIGAALLVTTARASLRALLGPYPPLSIDLAGVLSTLNDIAERDFGDDKFVTMFLGIYDPRERRLRYASAGHDPAMLVFRARTRTLDRLESTGLPLGMFFGLRYEQRTTDPLEPGDVLLLMTDGVTEAPSTTGDQFGDRRVVDLVWANNDAHPEALVQTLLAALSDFTQGSPQRDDITMLCLKVV